MKRSHVRAMIVLSALYLGAVASFAQDAAKPSESVAQSIPALPSRFTGLLIRVTDGFQQVTNALELQITNQSADGKVSAAYSRAVRVQGNPVTLCLKADNLPGEGTYDGERLILKIKGSRNSSICDDYTLTFLRGKEHYFELKAADGSSYLDPVK